MGSVWFVAVLFLALGTACVLLPEKIAHLGLYLDAAATRPGSRKILARYPRVTRWSGRIAGGLLIAVGLLLLFVARFAE
jgi:threonine/homoserine/homoserine lactone efflux protein